MSIKLRYSLFCFGLVAASTVLFAGTERPNILLLVGDDFGTDLSCYGHADARTPHLDALAKEGIRFEKAFTPSSVCAPARSALMTGRYPTSLGTHHMRSRLADPPKVLTEYLREIGYTVVWPYKTDFNFEPPQGFRDSAENWLEGPLPEEPFLAYFNFGETHEGALRSERIQGDFLAEVPEAEWIQPEEVSLPPYYPDTPEVRADLAMHYNLIQGMDKRIGGIRARLDAEGLAENTLVIFLGDGGRPFPRSKRWLYDEGLHVPLILSWPGHLPAGEVNDELVSFVDIAPTVLSLLGQPVPEAMQGRVIAGEAAEPSPEYVFAARDRIGKVMDRSRAVRSKRFKYIRNYMPEVPYAHAESYADQSATMQVIRRHIADSTLPQAGQFWMAAAKPEEELYDIEVDPHEVNNLVGDPTYLEQLQAHRLALDAWIAKDGDVGAIPEAELLDSGFLKPWPVKK